MAASEYTTLYLYLLKYASNIIRDDHYETIIHRYVSKKLSIVLELYEKLWRGSTFRTCLIRLTLFRSACWCVRYIGIELIGRWLHSNFIPSRVAPVPEGKWYSEQPLINTCSTSATSGWIFVKLHWKIPGTNMISKRRLNGVQKKTWISFLFVQKKTCCVTFCITYVCLDGNFLVSKSHLIGSAFWLPKCQWIVIVYWLPMRYFHSPCHQETIEINVIVPIICCLHAKNVWTTSDSSSGRPLSAAIGHEHYEYPCGFLHSPPPPPLQCFFSYFH